MSAGDLLKKKESDAEAMRLKQAKADAKKTTGGGEEKKEEKKK